MLFGLFQSKKEDTVSREVAVYLREKLLATEVELENLAAHSDRLISENTSLLNRVDCLEKSNYFYDLACKAYEKEVEVKLSQLAAEKNLNELHLSEIEVIRSNLKLMSLEALSYKTINSDLKESNKYLRGLAKELAQKLVASRKACEHMRKTRH